MTNSANRDPENLSNESTPRRLLRQLIEHAPDAMMVVDDQDRIMVVNARVEQLFGYKPTLIFGQSPQRLFPEWCSRMTRAVIEHPIADSGNVHNMPARRSNGEKFCAEVSLSNIVLNHHQFVVAGIRDTTPNSLALHALETLNLELIETNQRLQSLSVTDPLTELLNRRGLENVLQREISYAQRNKSELLAVLVDLDDFKSINDDGHATGDRVLREIAKVLKSGLRTIDWIGRIGGDEFLILLPNTPLSVGIVVADRIRLALTQHEVANLRGGRSKVTASLALAVLPGHISTIEEVLELTSATLKESKANGKNRVSIGGNNFAPDRATAIKIHTMEQSIVLPSAFRPRDEV